MEVVIIFATNILKTSLNRHKLDLIAYLDRGFGNSAFELDLFLKRHTTQNLSLSGGSLEMWWWW